MVLTDWNMPIMDGIELVEKIRSTPEYERLPILLFTARSTKEDVLRALQAGIDTYITKPFTPQQLQTKIQTALTRRSRQQITEILRGQDEIDRDEDHPLIVFGGERQAHAFLPPKAHYLEAVFVHMDDGVGGLFRIHHPRKSDEVPLGQTAVIASVIVAVHVRNHATATSQRGQHIVVVPQIVHILRINREVAKQNHPFLRLLGLSERLFKPIELRLANGTVPSWRARRLSFMDRHGDFAAWIIGRVGVQTHVVAI